MPNTPLLHKSKHNLPPITRSTEPVKQSARLHKPLYISPSALSFHNVTASFGIALHMHQPTIPAGGDDLHSAGLISNLQYMLEHPETGDNHNAPVFLQCYSRMSDFVRELVSQGYHPRVMLDYSGNLLWGLAQIDEGRVLENLKRVTCDEQYQGNVEWLGTMWSHAVVTSTPVPDVPLHLHAWRTHFAAIFGETALARVKGFSPPEMHLPIHPDVCYEYIKTLKECGYEWLLVQEHTIENIDGTTIRRPHFPHRLVAKNSLGETQEITVLIKTQGSDTKLIGQMQPYYEACSNTREAYAGHTLPPFVLQISDGENGGVMMNEFPPKYQEVFHAVGTSGVVALNGSEYLECLREAGVNEKDFMKVQPISQHHIWAHVSTYEPHAADQAIEKAKAKHGELSLDKGSWTNDKNWVSGYEDVLDPMNKLSVEFHRRCGKLPPQPPSTAYQEALLYLLLSQTSCFRYWGTGLWTDYAKEICRRGFQALERL